MFATLSDKSLLWYTKDSFVYRKLNEALRLQNIDILFLFRFFFHSICWYGPENTFGKKKLGPSYKKFRDRGHFLGTCLILWKLCKNLGKKQKYFPKQCFRWFFTLKKMKTFSKKNSRRKNRSTILKIPNF